MCFHLLLRPLALIALTLLLVPAGHAKKPRPLAFSTTGINGYALPMWPKVADTIHVTSCDEGSPAFGKLKEGDIIVGIGNKKFTDHPLGQIPKLLDEAEAADGKMILLLDTGKKVTLQLPKLGAYSPTAPYHCPKTDTIIEQAAERLMKEEGLGSTPTRAGLLGLMATGEQRHLDVVTPIMQNKLARFDQQAIDEYLKTGKGDFGSTGWTWGYRVIALSEYYLLTKDETVLPAIRAYGLGLARGQDPVGLWGHRMATEAMKGRAPGYGIMNQCSMSNFMGMLLARKCGINDPVLDAAIERTNAYVADHIGKGGFPYGVHGHKPDIFNNNGSSASAAICMALMDNKEGSKYFSRITIPTHDKLTLGHASHFFNPLWTPLGASLSGPEVTQEFFKRSLWYFNAKRHWKGGFPGKGRSGYFAGQALLTYCLPRKVLYITGREADESIWVRDSNEIDRLMGLNQIDYKGLSDEKLFELLEDPIIQVRTHASREMSGRLTFKWANKLDEAPYTPILLDKIKNGSEQEKVIALNVLGGIFRDQSKHFAGTFAEVMNNTEESHAVRLAAACAFQNCGEATLPYLDDIFRFTLEDHPGPDPFGHVDKQLAKTFESILKDLHKNPESLEKLRSHETLRYQVASQFLDHPRQNVRGTGIKLLEGINLEGFHIVGEKLMYVLNDEDPSYHTYSSVLNADGINILADLNIKEGLDLLEDGIFHGDGKWGFKYRALIKALPSYGAHAKPYLPKYEAHKDINKPGDRFTPDWQKAVEIINNDKNPKKLMTAEEAIQMGKKLYQEIQEAERKEAERKLAEKTKADNTDS
jgi:hypothetical protein